MRWDHRPEAATWTQTSMSMIAANDAVLAAKVPADALAQLKQARAASPVLDKMVQMREELSQIWLNTSHSREQLAADLQAWCRRAEESGIAALRDFSVKLRAVRQAT